jgi:DNA-binding phage protein
MDCAGVTPVIVAEDATLAFTDLAEATHISSKSLMKMLGPSANPRADNLFEIVSFLQRREGLRFEVKTSRA